MKRTHVAVFLVLAAAAAALPGCREPSSRANVAAQHLVDHLVALHPAEDQKQLDDIMSGGVISNRFDVNRYFSVLDKLRPEAGYVLDWVYKDCEIDGLPVLYVRKAEACPFTSFEKYAAFTTNTPPTGALSAAETDERLRFGYVERLRVDDSPEGYFQLVVLRLLGDRFHMFWHEYYSETFLVCSKAAWESRLQKEQKRGEPYDPPPPSFIAAADKMDFTPSIRMGSKQAEVKVTTYMPFRGLDEHTFLIARQFPHRILNHTATNFLAHTQSFDF